MFKIPTILRNRSLIQFLLGRILIVFAFQMMTVAIGWQIYSITGSAFYLGLVGLTEFFPMFMLTLVVGYVADHFNRKLIICICQTISGIGILTLSAGSFGGWISKESILITIFFIAAANAFQGPPMQALLPNIVSKEDFPQAAAWSASAFQFSVIVGPAFGGILYVFGAGAVYLAAGAMAILAAFMISFISVTNEQTKREPVSFKSLFAGISFIKSKPTILGAISLDLFAVLFGGATALLPVYAKSILKIGPFGLGILRSAPAAGALITSVWLARRPLKRKVGVKMFTAVIIFGLSTILFAVSKLFVLTLAALFVLGASDIISVVIRATLIQLETPDNMRGRVSSVNQVFIGTSNQLGEFESGLTAFCFGVVPAALIGGIGTILVVLTWMKLFPSLLHRDKLESA